MVLSARFVVGFAHVLGLYLGVVLRELWSFTFLKGISETSCLLKRESEGWVLMSVFFTSLKLARGTIPST